jgi:hypothetical protein
MPKEVLAEPVQKQADSSKSRERLEESLDSRQSADGRILQLQRAMGNRRVAELIGSGQITRAGRLLPIQTRLRVGVPDDLAEVEADRAADAIVAGTPSPITDATVRVQRDTAQAGPAAATPTAPATDDIRTIHDAFVSAKTDAEIKFSNVSQQQGAIAQELKEAAKEKDPPPIEVTILAGIVGAAISAVLPGVGSAMAALTTQALAQTAVKAAFEKGAEKASEIAKEKITTAEDEHIADAYFNGMALTYPALAGHYQDGFSASMNAVWGTVGSDVAKAKDAQQQAEGAKTALQQGLDSKSFAQQTKDGAFSGFSNVLAQKNAGGILQLETTVANKGNIGGKVIESAVVGGITSRLAGLVAGRPLAAYKMAVTITASYFTEATKTGGSTDPDVPRLHTFTVNIDASGKARVPDNPDQWLLDRGNGNAMVGAQGLYDDLKDVAIPIKTA